jgi:hypothetical protein
MERRKQVSNGIAVWDVVGPTFGGDQMPKGQELRNGFTCGLLRVVLFGGYLSYQDIVQIHFEELLRIGLHTYLMRRSVIPVLAIFSSMALISIRMVA